MKLKKLYTSIQFEENLVSDELIRRFKKGTVYSPFKDKGIDLILQPNLKLNKVIRLQVKKSRVYEKGGWIRIKFEKVKKYLEFVDYMIFVSYEKTIKKGSINLRPYYLIFPIKEFYNLAKLKTTKICHFYLKKEKKVVIDDRKKSDLLDYSRYLNAFNLIK